MMKEKQQKVIVGALVHKEGKFLIIKRAMDEKVFPGKWELPSGKIDFGEHPEQAIMREVKEETGLETENLEFFGTRNYVFETTVDGNHMTRHNIELVYLITPKKGQVNLSEEHEAFAWVKSDEARNYDVFKELPNFIKEAELKLNKKC